MAKPFDQYACLALPNGAAYFVRMSVSGIVLDQDERAVDLELAADLMAFKAWKLCTLAAQGCG